MSFFPSMNVARKIRPEGSPNARIAIVGDYTSAFDDQALRPFQGAAGQVLGQCLHLAGLIRGEVYLTNVIKSKPTRRAPPKSANGPCPEFFLEGKAQFTETGLAHVEELREELNATDCNVVVACGRAASVALAGVKAVAARRGYVHESIGLNRVVKVIPTHHPGQALRGNFTYRHMITCDLKKAKHESQFPELIRPDRHLVFEYTDVDECLRWIEYFKGKSPLAVDIEVINFEVSCVNLSDQPGLGVVIPIAGRWTLEEEAAIWMALVELLEDESTTKVLQNAIFDIQFMLTKGVRIRGPIHDTMVGHSCMYPELPKGLGFLGSIYCGAQEYWKDMVKFDDIKENS
jgi:uracil-DNA glycosylase family 4